MQAMAVLIQAFKPDQPPGEDWDRLTGKSANTGIWRELSRARDQTNLVCTVLVPVHCQDSKHWTLLTLRRKASQEGLPPHSFQVLYFDSLPEASVKSAEAAKTCLLLMARLLGPAHVHVPVCSLTELRGLSKTKLYHQTDSWSCGYWVLREAVRAGQKVPNKRYGP